MSTTIQKDCKSCGRVFRTESDYLTGTSRWRVCSGKNLWFNCDCNSTLMIPAGKFDWYSPEKHMSKDAGSVFNLISQKNQLPHIPSIVMKVQQLLQDPDTPVKALANTVKQEPIVASNVFKTANRIKATRDRHAPPFQSLEHAMVFIGTKSLGDIVLSASLHTFEFPTKNFHPDLVWKPSAICAAIAEEVAKRYRPQISKDEAYLAGYLANIGKIVAALCFPEKVDQISQEVYSHSSLKTWSAVEIQYGLTDHSVLGEVGAALWGLPDFVLETCRFHHRQARQSQDLEPHEGLIEVVSFANYLTHWVMLHPHRIHERKFEMLKQFFKLSDEDVFELAESIKSQISDLLD
ncbi:MAG: HDOD domain-containing protein [Oligoflexales bacterium]